jgi:hypothetical protein
MVLCKRMGRSSSKNSAYLNSPGNELLPLPFTCTRKQQKTNMILLLAMIFLQTLVSIFITAPPNLYGTVIVDMVPSGYWTKEKISNLTTIWNYKRKPTLGNENKVESAKEEITMEISAQTVKSKAKYDTNLDQIITNLPPARTSKLVLIFQ